MLPIERKNPVNETRTGPGERAGSSSQTFEEIGIERLNRRLDRMRSFFNMEQFTAFVHEHLKRCKTRGASSQTKSKFKKPISDKKSKIGPIKSSRNTTKNVFKTKTKSVIKRKPKKSSKISRKIKEKLP